MHQPQLPNWQLLHGQPPSPLTELDDPLLRQHGLRLLLKRDDLLHPLLGGNKWRKLKYNLLQAQQQGKTALLTFGGAYSNHVAAVAAAGQLLGFNTTGIIRGEEHLPLNPTLQRATAQGMRLHYLDRETYRHKTNREVLQQLLEQTGQQQAYVLPEGGSNALAVQGCAELVQELDQQQIAWDYLCAPAGTGGSLAGLVAGAAGRGEVLGFPALKGGEFLQPVVEELVQSHCGCHYPNWQLITQYHFGGYAKMKPELQAFIQSFRERHGVQLEPIYNGKMLYGIFDVLQKGFFPKGSTVVAWHTGGLQWMEEPEV